MGWRLAIVLVAATLWSSGQTPDLVRVELHDEAMGSTFAVVLYGSNKDELGRAAEAAFDEAHRLDRLLSNYRPDSEWSEVNRTAALRPLKLSAELFQLLSDCMTYSRQSDGAFDITVGPPLAVGFYWAGAAPSAEVPMRRVWAIGVRPSTCIAA